MNHSCCIPVFVKFSSFLKHSVRFPQEAPVPPCREVPQEEQSRVGQPLLLVALRSHEVSLASTAAVTAVISLAYRRHF